ncbi:hypothetical protein DM02DRAFT_658644 [Periconia macrospinosa]|uniref:Uncharacterized protein n=1 Tax=Periconia macrospinosa TaxID=97972 RepID=A0A2V1DG10_9PLEO|nr:hypothetical protein DM02DRAFT_658644 [Periconia macrospinosa]
MDTGFIWYDEKRTAKEVRATKAMAVSVHTVFTIMKKLNVVSDRQLDDEREKIWTEWKFNGFDEILRSSNTGKARHNDVQGWVRKARQNDVWDWARKARYRGKKEDYHYKFDKLLLELGHCVQFAKRYGKREHDYAYGKPSTEAELLSPKLPSREYRFHRAGELKVGPEPSRLLEATEPGNLSSNDTNLYHKLPNNDWFRVLVIVPGEFDSPIIAWLKTFRREDIIGQYEALSYSWTERYAFDEVDSKTCKVECNHKEISVNQSLGVALPYLRRPASYITHKI